MSAGQSDQKNNSPAGRFSQQMISSVFWKYCETFFSTIVAFVIAVITTRLLGPKVIGTVAMVMVVVNFANVLVQCGFNKALIQRAEVDDTDYASSFFVTTIVAVALYAMLFLAAPRFAAFCEIPEMTGLLRVMSLQLLPAGLVSVQNALVARSFRFRAAVIPAVASQGAAGAVGLLMAFSGYGAWALITQYLLAVYVNCILLAFFVPWKPKLIFSWKSVTALFSFGGKTLLSALLDSIYQELSSLFIGKRFSTQSLGYYNKGMQFPSQLVLCIDNAVQSIALPAYSAQQHDTASLRSLLRRTVKSSTFVVFPVAAGLAAVADPMIRLILGESWIKSIPFLQIYCLVQLAHPLLVANIQAIDALGRSDITLRMNAYKKAFGFFTLFIALRFDIFAVAWSVAVSNLVFFIIDASRSGKLLQYGPIEQLRDCLPALLLSAAMYGTVSLWRLAPLSALPLLVVQAATGALVYVLLSKLFRIESYAVLKNIIRNYLRRT